MQEPEKKLDAESQAILKQAVRMECLRRNKLYAACRIDIDDGRDPEAKKLFLLQKLREWKGDPYQFIRDCAWAHDLKGRFGAGAVPKGVIAPAGMVPVMPYPVQREIIADWKRCQESDTEEASVTEKSRQIFYTGLMLWLALHSFLFDEGGKTGVTSYDKDVIDKGGKGQRTEDTLFGSMRSYLDSLVTCLPQLRFNKNAARKTFGELTMCGLRDSQDINMKITRPGWHVYGQRMFPEAEGNYIVGDLPGDSLFRGLKLRNALLDELGQFNENRNDVDRDSWASCQAAAKNRFGGGTLPKKGGTASYFYRLLHDDEFSKIAKQRSIHWSDIYPYMAGGAWICRSCGHENPHPENEPPGRDGIDRTCARCDLEQHVVFRDMTSPWFKKMCALALGDRTTIAREYQLDWMASQGDVLFSTLSPNLVIPFRDSPASITLEGFDPGQSMKNPGAWIAHRFCPKSKRLCTFGYWMSINPHPEYWVPFLKHWNSRQAGRIPIVYGKLAGRTFRDAFDYPDEALRIMDHVAKFPLGDIRGDKYGAHSVGRESVYDVFGEYNVWVDWEKTPDREDLVRNGVEWGARLSLDRAIAEIEPPTPLGGRFPSVLTAFQTAKPRESDAEGRRPYDVSKKTPPHVHGLIDAHLYAVRDLDQVHALVGAGGEWGVEPVSVAEIVQFGDDLPGS